MVKFLFSFAPYTQFDAGDRLRNAPGTLMFRADRNVTLRLRAIAAVAQLVEQCIRNAWVRCSSHLSGTSVPIEGAARLSAPILVAAPDVTNVPLDGRITGYELT